MELLRGDEGFEEFGNGSFGHGLCAALIVVTVYIVACQWNAHDRNTAGVKNHGVH